MKKFIFLVGAAIGFIAGSAAGRGPYEQLMAKSKEVSENPEVQAKAQQAKERAAQVAEDTTTTVKDRAPGVAQGMKDAAGKAGSAVAGAAASAKDRVTSSSSDADFDGTAAGDAEVGDDKPLAP